MRKLLLLCFALFPILLQAQTIESIQLPKTAFRLGENFNVSIKTTGIFAPGNIFAIQISDSFGNFTNPTVIGTVSARTDTIVICQIPDTLPVSKHYKMRAVASNPAFTSMAYPQSILLYFGKVYYVSQDGDDSNDGSSQNPFKTIQKAIDVSWYYDTILVRPGTYSENLVFRGIDVALIGVNGAEQTIIDGQKNGSPVITLENGESSATIIDGFTIQNGVNYQMDNGPGITIKYDNTAPILRNLIIKNNEAWAFGGGIYCYNAGKVKIVNCIIENNSAKYFGSGIYTDQTNIEVEKCIIRKNSSGGIYNWRSYSNIINSLIYWNNSNEVTIFSDLGIQMKPKIINSTIVSKGKFYSFYLYGRFIADVLNTIFYGSDSTIAVIGDAYDTIKIDHSIVFQYPNKFYRDKAILTTGKFFISDDPMFVDPNNENFSLDSCSPAIGVALKTVAPVVDVYGYPRPIEPENEDNPDIGAVESPKTQRSSNVAITSVSNTKFCKGGSFTISYTVSGCPFYSGNEFIAELSNSTGTFNPSYELGKVQSVNSGTINCTIPQGVPSGANYKVRIRATNLPYRSQPFSQSLAIYDNPKVTIFGSKQVCSAREYEYWTDSSESPTNKWIIKNGYSYNNLTENKIKVIWYDSSSGSIKLIQTNIAGCMDSTVLNVTILPTPPKPSIQQLQDGQLVSSNPSWNQWFYNGSPIQGATGRIYKPTKNGFYSVKIIPPYGCESDMSDSIYVVVSEVEDGGNSLIVVEIIGDMLLVRRVGEDNKRITFSLTNILGQKVWKGSIEEGEMNKEFGLYNINSGVYFLLINSPNLSYSVKVVKINE